MTERKLSNAARIYIGAVCLAGAATIVSAAAELYYRPVGWRWLLLAVLTLNKRLRNGEATVCPSHYIDLSNICLYCCLAFWARGGGAHSGP